MLPIRAMSEVFEAIQKAKAGGSAFHTNFFPAQSKLQGWIDHGELVCESSDRVALFLRKDRGFWHAYFCAATTEALHGAIDSLSGLKTERVVVDLVGTETAIAGVLNLFELAGFRRHTRLFRMSRIAKGNSLQAVSVEPRIGYAEIADAETILALLSRSFDPYAEQLPMLYEIKAAVENRQILVGRCDGTLAGLLFSETHGMTSTIRYWLVAEKFQAQRFGAALMRHYLATHSAVRRFILWVIDNNENAITKYAHYGFAPDGLVDHVIANEMILS